MQVKKNSRCDFRWTLCIVAMGVLGGCGQQNKSTVAATTPVPYESKADYHRAALLNVQMGQQYLEQGQVARAKKKLVHALELESKLPEGHNAMGYFYETVGDSKLAEKHYKKAVRYGQKAGAFLNNYGAFLCRQLRFDEAEKAFFNALKDEDYTKTAEIYENAGLCALRANNKLKAENYLYQSVRYDPRNTSALLALSELTLSLRKISESQKIYDQLQSMKDQKPTARSLWLGIQLAREHNHLDKEASLALLLKNKFGDSIQYQLYLQSKPHERS